MRKNEAKWVNSRSRWQINVQKNGDRQTFISKLVGTKGKIEAEKKADKWLESGIVLKPIRLSKLSEMYLEDIEMRTGKSNYKKEKNHTNHILEDLKYKKITSITAQDWQNVINRLYAEDLSKKTLKNIKATITGLYKFAKKNKIAIESSEDVVIPKQAYAKPKTILQPNMLKILFAENTINGEPAFYIHAWRFIVVSGVRRGECCGLKKIDISDTTISINRSINEENETTQGKNQNARRPLVKSRWLTNILKDQEIMLAQKGIISPWIFPFKDGGYPKPTAVYKEWKRYREEYGINCSLHELRHTMVSIANTELKKESIQEWVGHSDHMDTISIYGHSVDGEIQKTANTLDRLFDKFIG